LEHEPRRQVRYRFGRFVVSPSRRTLLSDGHEVPLIARYFDLLVLLVARRGEAIHRRDILDLVWGDVVVSDGALSQAVRTLRRALDDDPKQPTFIRTVQRHGYRFVFADVIEEPDDGTLATTRGRVQNPEPGRRSRTHRPGARAVAAAGWVACRRRGPARGGRRAACAWHRRSASQPTPCQATGRAQSRDTRWDVATAGPSQSSGSQGLRASMAVFSMRLGRVWRLAGNRWLGAVAGASVAASSQGRSARSCCVSVSSTATSAIFAALPAVGVWIGAPGAAGVAAGLVTAEVLFRSQRALALVVGGAAGGGFVGAVTHLLGRSALAGLFGGDLDQAAGGFEGMTIGAGVGLGYAIAADPEGAARTSKRSAVAAAGIAWRATRSSPSRAQLGATSSTWWRMFPTRRSDCCRSRC
jgi:DNA-binding winged helix-turn-helix (wHTH) protein